MPSLFIISPAAYARGGVETIIHDLCAELPKRRWDVVLGLAAGKFHDAERYRTLNPGLPIHVIRAPFSTRRARAAAIMESVRSVSADVVMATRIGDTYEAIARLKRSGHASRLVVAVQGFEAQYILDVKNFNGIIDSCFTAGELACRACISIARMEPERVFNLPGGVRPPDLPPKPRSPGRMLRIAYVGRLAQADKRVLDIIPLTHLLSASELKFSLDIVGAGPDEGALKDALGSWRDRVRFHGWLSRDDLYERIYPEIDCVLNFSPTEGSPIAPREALAHGVVCVLSRFPGLQLEGVFIHGHNALTFPTGDVKMAVRHLISLQREPGLLARFSTNALKAQQGKYTFGGSADAWADALNQCLAMPSKFNLNSSFKTQPGGRLEKWGVPGQIADRVRWWLGREIAPTSSGAEWPHGCVPILPSEQSRLESWAAEQEKACKYGSM